MCFYLFVVVLNNLFRLPTYPWQGLSQFVVFNFEILDLKSSSMVLSNFTWWTFKSNTWCLIKYWLNFVLGETIDFNLTYEHDLECQESYFIFISKFLEIGNWKIDSNKFLWSFLFWELLTSILIKKLGIPKKLAMLEFEGIITLGVNDSIDLGRVKDSIRIW